MDDRRMTREELEELINHDQDQEQREETIRDSNPIVPGSTLIGQIPQQEREEQIIREDTQRD